MCYNLPPLNWVRAFEAAARAGSFTAAAEELSLTSAAVSHQVRSLEQHLGFQLFERLPRSLRLTDMGQAYLPSVRRAFDELSTTTYGLFGVKGGQSITIRSNTAFATLWLVPRLSMFSKLHPEIDIRLLTSLWVDSLASEESDLDISFGDGRWPGFIVELLKNEDSIAVCSPEVSERIAQMDDLSELQQLRFIHTIGREGRWEEFLAKMDLQLNIDLGIKVDTSLNALEMAASGMGLALVQESYASAYFADGRLVKPFEHGLPNDESHYLLLPEGQKRPKPEVLMFRDWLLAEAKGDKG